MLFSKCYFFNDAFVQKAIGLHVLIINHLIYYVNKRTLDVMVGGYCVGVQLQYQKGCGVDLAYMSSVPLKKCTTNNQMGSKVFRVKLQLLFDPVLHQKTEVGVCYWKAVTHIYLLFGLLCCKTETDKGFTFSFVDTQNGLL